MFLGWGLWDEYFSDDIYFHIFSGDFILQYTKNIPEPKHGESFYSESFEDGLDIIKTMRWELLYTDTIHQKGYRDVYLFHYKNLE